MPYRFSSVENLMPEFNLMHQKLRCLALIPGLLMFLSQFLENSKQVLAVNS